MIKIVGVRFKSAGKIYYFDPVDLEVEKNMEVVVETARGLEYGKIVVGPKEIEEEELISPLKPIIRIATDEDRQVYNENKEKAKETFEATKDSDLTRITNEGKAINEELKEDSERLETLKNELNERIQLRSEKTVEYNKKIEALQAKIAAWMR